MNAQADKKSPGVAMRSGSAIAFTLLFCGYVSFPISHGQEALSAKELIRHVVSNRAAISSGLASIKLEHPVLPAHYSDYRGVIRTYKIVFDDDGSCSRSTANWDTPRSQWVQHMLKNSQGVFVDPGDSHPHASMSADADKESLQINCFNIRLLGIYPDSLTGLPCSGVESAMKGIVDGIQNAVEAEEVDGITAKKVVASFGENGILAMWLAEGFDYNPVRLVLSSSSGDDELEIRSEYRKCKFGEENSKDGIWFPRTVICTTSSNGEIVKQDRVVVEEAVFQVPIPENEFEMASLGIREGRRVIGDGSSEYVWKGNELKRANSRDW